MAATSEGVSNCRRFLGWAKSTTGDVGVQVKDCALAQDWQGVVSLAQESAFDFEHKPFTADDAEAVMDAWNLVAMPDDMKNEAAGGLLIIRPFSQNGVLLLSSGGVVATANDGVLRTSDDSVNAGSPVGEPKVIPLFDSDTGAISEEDSDWMLSETSTGELAFFQRGKAKLVIRTNGKVWTVQNDELKRQLGRDNGYLKAGSESPIDAGVDLMNPIFGSASWSIAQTDRQHLAFRCQANGTLAMVAAGDGRLWGGQQNGYFKEDDLSFDWDALWAQMEILWGNFTDVLDEGWDWVVDAAEDSWAWLENAVGDAWDWVEDSAEDLWGTITDPDTWNPAKW